MLITAPETKSPVSPRTSSCLDEHHDYLLIWLLVYPVGSKQHQSHSEYVKNLKARLEESYNLASQHALKTAERNKTRFDQKVTTSVLEVGDRVLVRNVRIRGKQKLMDKWESDVYVVIKRAGDLLSIQ